MENTKRDIEHTLNEWHFAAVVLDRLCLYLFSGYLVISTILIFGLRILRFPANHSDDAKYYKPV